MVAESRSIGVETGDVPNKKGVARRKSGSTRIDEKFQKDPRPKSKRETCHRLQRGRLGESMGNVFNYPTEPAPNEQYLWVQRPAACNEAGCDWVPNTPMMPHVANALSVPEWTTFMNRVTLCVNDFDQKVEQMGCRLNAYTSREQVCASAHVFVCVYLRAYVRAVGCIELQLGV